MANFPVRFSLSVIDGKRRRANVISYLSMPEATTVTGLNTALDAWKTLYVAVASPQVLTAEVKVLRQMTPDAAPAGFADSRVAEVGVFDFLTGASNQHYGQQTPALDDSKLLANGQPNDADGDVAAWIAQFTGGAFTNPEQQALATYSYSFSGVRKRRRPVR